MLNRYSTGAVQGPDSLRYYGDTYERKLAAYLGDGAQGGLSSTWDDRAAFNAVMDRIIELRVRTRWRRLAAAALIADPFAGTGTTVMVGPPPGRIGSAWT